MWACSPGRCLSVRHVTRALQQVGAQEGHRVKSLFARWSDRQKVKTVSLVKISKELFLNL